MRWLAAALPLAAGCTPAPAALVVSLDAAIETVVLEDAAWRAEGAFTLRVEAAPGEDPNEVVVRGANLELCANDAEMKARTFAGFPGELEALAQQPMPLVVEPSGQVKGIFALRASGPLRILPGWDGWWCAPRGLSCGAEGGLLYIRAADRHGPIALQAAVQPLVDDRRELAPPPQPVGALWAQTGSALERPQRPLAIDELGRIVLVAEPDQPALVGLDPEGSIRWSRALAATGGRYLASRGGRVVMVTSVDAPTTLFETPLTPSDGAELVVVVLAADDGRVLHATLFSSPGDQRAVGVALDADGSVVMAVASTGDADFGGGVLAAGEIVVRLESDGTHRSSRRVAPSSAFSIAGLALTGAGDVVLGGELLAPIDFGAGLVDPGDASEPVAMVSLDGVGALRFATLPAGVGGPVALASGPTGAVHVAIGAMGGVAGRLDERGALTDVVRLPPVDALANRFAVDEGDQPMLALGHDLWRSVGGKGVRTRLACDGGFFLASGPAGDVALVGEFEGVFSVDQGPLELSGPSPVVARLRAP